MKTRADHWRARAAACDDHHRRHPDQLPDDNPGVVLGLGVICALLSISHEARGIRLELRRIRRGLEGTVRLNLSGSLVPKHSQGGSTMPAGPFNPDKTQDVQFTINPLNAGGQPTTGPFNWTLSDGSAGILTPAADGKSALFVTSPTLDTFDCMVTVADPHTGVTDTARVSRGVIDNNTVSLSLSGSLVAKAPPAA